MSDPRYPALYQINTRVWLTELSRALGRRATLDDIPDAEGVTRLRRFREDPRQVVRQQEGQSWWRAPVGPTDRRPTATVRNVTIRNC